MSPNLEKTQKKRVIIKRCRGCLLVTVTTKQLGLHEINLGNSSFCFCSRKEKVVSYAFCKIKKRKEKKVMHDLTSTWTWPKKILMYHSYLEVCAQYLSAMVCCSLMPTLNSTGNTRRGLPSLISSGKVWKASRGNGTSTVKWSLCASRKKNKWKPYRPEW